jgi:uncharacterized protein (TIGR02285 family)
MNPANNFFIKKSEWYVISLILMAFLYTTIPSIVVASDKPIELIYHDRPPFYIRQNDGSVTGVVAEPAAHAFKNAKVDFKWRLLPANRQLETVKANKSKVCAVGWFKNPQREQYSKYTTHIYQEKPMVAVIRTDNKALSVYQTLNKLLADDGLKMGGKLGYSYGDYIDSTVKKYKTHLITSTQSNTGLIRMLLANRFDYTFIPGDELNDIMKQSVETARKISVMDLRDMPEGNKRYIMCSKQVENEIINRLNAEIIANRM